MCLDVTDDGTLDKKRSIITGAGKAAGKSARARAVVSPSAVVETGSPTPMVGLGKSAKLSKSGSAGFTQAAVRFVNCVCLDIVMCR